MKRAVIVHCWGGAPKYAWYSWVKYELENKGYTVSVPAMPDTDHPKLNLWLPKLMEVIGTPDGELVLIGHSIGCATIMRYLENLDSHQQVGQVIFVAGFTDNLGFDELINFFEEPLNFNKIKQSVKNGIVAVQSDNDPYVAAKYSDILSSELDAKVITKHGARHMSGPVDNEKSCVKLPEVISVVI